MLSCFSGPRETQLTLPLLTAALKFLPCRFELSGANGLRFSNRAPGPHDGVSTAVVPVTKNVNLTYWSAPAPNNNTLSSIESIDAIVWQAKLEREGAVVAGFRGNQRWREFYGLDESVTAWFGALHPDHVSSAKAAWEAAIRNSEFPLRIFSLSIESKLVNPVASLQGPRSTTSTRPSTPRLTSTCGSLHERILFATHTEPSALLSALSA